MNVKMRQEVEKKIITAALKGLLAAGFAITVNDGEEEVIKQSTDAEAIIATMFSTDEDTFIVFRKEGERGWRQIGWVAFIYGNDGPDVIHDFTMNLEEHLKDAKVIADSYS